VAGCVVSACCVRTWHGQAVGVCAPTTPSSQARGFKRVRLPIPHNCNQRHTWCSATRLPALARARTTTCADAQRLHTPPTPWHQVDTQLAQATRCS
jgi:hypothetical protein